MKNIYKLVISLKFVFAILIVNAQTIDYSYETLSTSSCNVFATATVIDNLEHLTALGRPKFSDNSIRLDCKANNSTTVLSTIYSIKYNFKANHNYKISINYRGFKNNPDGLYPAVGLKISSTNGGSDANTNCANPSAYTIADELTFVHGASGNTYATAPNLINSTINQSATHLLVAAFPASGTTQEAQIYVRNIVITETAPTAVFTLAPTSLNVQCGTPVTQTFTVTNVSNTQGVTGYDWNLGSGNNGWIYNGSPAPQTISTPTNSISLTSTNCAVKSNVSAVAKVGSSNYSTNTSVVNNTLPSMSISGAQEFCSGTSTYTISGVPCGATITWSADPVGIASLSPNGSQVVLTQVGDRNITLTATVTNACGQSTVTSIPVNVGIPNIWADVQNVDQYDCFQQNTTYYFSVTNPQPGIQYKWGYISPNATTYMDPGATNATTTTFNFWNEGSYGIIVVPYNVCGDGNYSELGIYVNPFWQTCGGGGYFSLQTAPNPSQGGDVFVTVLDQKPEVKSLNKEETVQMDLYDFYSKKLAKQWRFKNDQNRYKLNTNGLKKGQYVLMVRKGKYFQSVQMVIK